MRVLDRREEPDIGMLCPQKRTLGTSCDTDGWIRGSMRLLDLSWQPVLGPDLWHNLPQREHLELQLTDWVVQLTQIYDRTQPAILLGNYEIPAVNPDSLSWGGTTSMASFLNRAFTSCSITRACSGPTSVGVTPLKRGGGKANWIRYPYSTVCRTHWDTFGSSFKLLNNLLREPASRGWPLVLETVARTPVTAHRQAGPELSVL